MLPPLFVEYLLLICMSSISNHFASLSPMTCLLSPLCPCCLFYNIHCHRTILSTHSLSLFYPLNSLAPLGLAFSVPSWRISVFLPLFSEHPSSFTSIWPESWVLLTLSVHLYRLHRLPHCRLPLLWPESLKLLHLLAPCLPPIHLPLIPKVFSALELTLSVFMTMCVLVFFLNIILEGILF